MSDIPEWRSALANEIVNGYDAHDDHTRRATEDEVRRIVAPFREGDTASDNSDYIQEDEMFDTKAREALLVAKNGTMSRMFPSSNKWFSYTFQIKDKKDQGNEDRYKRGLERLSDLQFKQLGNDNFYGGMMDCLDDFFNFGTTNLRMTKGNRRFANFQAIEKGNYVFQVDDEGFSDLVWVNYRLTVHQIRALFGDDGLPEKLSLAAEKHTEQNKKFTIIHRITRRDKFTKGKTTNPEKREYESIWVCKEDKDLIGNATNPKRKIIYKDGLYYNPYTIGRLIRRAGQNQGEGITTMMLPLIRTANQKAQNIEMAENFKVQPAWYQDDSNPIDDFMVPNGRIGVDIYSQFKPEPVTMPEGGIDYEKSGLEAIHRRIDTMFFVDAFKFFTQQDIATNRKTAFETQLMKNEQNTLLISMFYNLSEEVTKPTLANHLELMLTENQVPQDILDDLPPTGEWEPVLTSQFAKSIESTKAEDLMMAARMGLELEQVAQGVSQSTVKWAPAFRDVLLTTEIDVEHLYSKTEAEEKQAEAQQKQEAMQLAQIANEAGIQAPQQ